MPREDLPSWLRARIAPSLLLAAPLALFAIAAWSRRWMSDDGYIYLRVVDQLLAGHGPVFNRGERVEAATSPLWVGLLAAAKSALPFASLPWLAVVLGLLLSLAGLAFALWGAYNLRRRARGGVVVPLGALVVVALPPFWDFATSGLETGLAFAWLGACFWGLVRLPRADATLSPAGGAGDRAKALSLQDPGQRSPVEPRTSNFELRATTLPFWLPVLIGLGVLIRPDFVIFALAFMAALFVLLPTLSWQDRAAACALALALPFAYQVFRMGYYGALVPNPAFAKEASLENWSQGWWYLVDLTKPYWLFVPLVLLLAAALPSLAASRRREMALIAAPVAGALAHGLYVVYLGGDFMHARMLLSAVFALLMPFAVIRIDRARAAVPAIGVVAWAIACAAVLRPPYDGVGPHGIANERAYYVMLAHNDHPVTLDDYRQYPGAVLALLQREQVSRGGLLLESGELAALRPGVPADGVIVGSSVGIYGYLFGTDVHVADVYGIVDPVAGRLQLAERGRPGHEKVLPEAWFVARFADPAAPPRGPDPQDIAAARAALACGDLRELLAAASHPMTPGRFARNLLDAFRLHRFRIAADPVVARDKLC